MSRSESQPIRATVLRWKDEDGEYDYTIVLIECVKNDLWWFEHECGNIGDSNMLFGERWKSGNGHLPKEGIPNTDVFVVEGVMFSESYSGMDGEEWDGGFEVKNMEPIFVPFGSRDFRRDMIFRDRRTKMFLPYPEDPNVRNHKRKILKLK